MSNLLWLNQSIWQNNVIDCWGMFKPLLFGCFCKWGVSIYYLILIIRLTWSMEFTIHHQIQEVSLTHAQLALAQWLWSLVLYPESLEIQYLRYTLLCLISGINFLNSRGKVCTLAVHGGLMLMLLLLRRCGRVVRVLDLKCGGGPSLIPVLIASWISSQLSPEFEFLATLVK